MNKDDLLVWLMILGITYLNVAIFHICMQIMHRFHEIALANNVRKALKQRSMDQSQNVIVETNKKPIIQRKFHMPTIDIDFKHTFFIVFFGVLVLTLGSMIVYITLIYDPSGGK